MTASPSVTSAVDIPLAAEFEPASEAQWRALVDKALKGQDFAKQLVSRTDDGIEIAPLYTRSRERPAALRDAPGEPPFTRGSPTRAAAVGWQIGQLCTETEPAALAEAVACDIAGGADCVTVRIAAPGQSGLPGTLEALHAGLDAAMATVPVGNRLRVSLMPGAEAMAAAEALITFAAARGHASMTVAGLGIDPLGTLARTGMLDLLDTSRPGFVRPLPWLQGPGTTLLADARPYHEAGASEAQELAALAATLVAYLRACEAGGLAPATALPRIGLALSADADLFATMAKLRAARRLVHRIADACGAGEAACRSTLAVTTSERMMARRDPWVNLLRTTAAASAAAMAGADEITVLPYSWALGQPDAFARRIARNTGLVLREEAQLGRIADPAGGAWHLEHLTHDLAAKAWSLFQAWEAAGGMLTGLTSGRVCDEIAAVAAARETAIAAGRRALTGTSAYPRLGDDGVSIRAWPSAPVVPARRVARPLVPRRLAAPFERLRDAADRAAVPPKVFLAALGTPAEHGARSSWITNVLAAGGIGVIATDGVTTSADAGLAFAQSGATVACMCATDATYAELGEATAMALKGAGATRVCLAGRPRETEAALRAAGVDTFLFAGMNQVDVLTDLQRALV